MSCTTAGLSPSANEGAGICPLDNIRIRLDISFFLCLLTLSHLFVVVVVGLLTSCRRPRRPVVVTSPARLMTTALAASPTTQSLPTSPVLDELSPSVPVLVPVPNDLHRPSQPPSPPAHPVIATPSTATATATVSKPAVTTPTSPVSVSVSVIVVCHVSTDADDHTLHSHSHSRSHSLLYSTFFLVSFAFAFPKLTFLLISSRPRPLIHLPKT